MSKTNDLLVKVSKRTTNGVESWEGTANLPGLTPAKVTKSKTDDSKFSTRSTLERAAQKLAVRYGFSEVKFEGAAPSDKPKARRTKKTESVETTLA